jgi:hypothetical protein
MRYFILAMLITVSACNEQESSFIATNFENDRDTLELRQVFSEPNGPHFIGIFFKDSDYSFGSGHKVMRLYTADSISIDELHFGAFPLEIKRWEKANIYLSAEVYSAHGDSATRRTYLNTSTNRNKRIGAFNLLYEKKYNDE